MKHYKLLGVFVFLNMNILSEHEYWYPLGIIKDERVLAMHQINDRLEVVLCNANNPADYVPALAPYHFPTNVIVLPNKQAFSFIDNGLLKIKELCKRSSSTILFEKPFKNIGSVAWLTNEICYFHALYKGSYGIFFSDRKGTIIHEVWHQGVDYTFPSHDQHSVFYAQYKDNVYSLWRLSYFIEENANFGSTEKIISNMHVAPFFITIIDENKGFFVSTIQEETLSEEVRLRLSCFCKKNTLWTLDWLFDFNIPKVFLHGKDRVYEMVKPFIPYYFNGFFYYSSFKYGKNHLCLFDIQKNRVLDYQVLNNFLFGLLPTTKSFYFGGSDGIILNFLDPDVLL